MGCDRLRPRYVSIITSYFLWSSSQQVLELVKKYKISTYLSSNKVHVRTIEDDAEGFHLELNRYSDLLQGAADAEAAKAHVLSLKGKNSRNQLPRIMRSSEILDVQLRLFTFSNMFHLSPHMSKTWITRNLMDVAGGVSP